MLVPTTVDGLPVHPLLIHATVVALPAASLAVLLAGVWPLARHWLRLTPLVLSVVALVLLPLSYQSGENLKKEVGSGPLIERHEHLAHQLLWPVIGLVIAAIVIEAARRISGRSRSTYRSMHDAGFATVAVIGALLGVVFAVWTTVQTVRVGEAGAKAVWGGVAGRHGGDSSMAPVRIGHVVTSGARSA